MGDLREWLAKVGKLGELKTLQGVHWDLEIGVITEIVGRQPEKPAILFDNIPDYPPSYRVLANPLGSRDRFALALGLPPGMIFRELLQEWRRRSHEMQLVAPRFVAGGPVMENVDVGEEVDVLKFPTPRWHEKDGGRFIGTGDMVITRTPEGDWVNCGAYRIMVHDRYNIGLQIAPAHHGYWHLQEWRARGEPMPVAIVVGMDPLLFLASCNELPAGLNEYYYAGAIQGEPVEVTKGPITGLPIPATAEIVLEGFVDPQEMRPEGPFGEFPGYYGGGIRDQPVVRVEAIYHRNDPIILGMPPLRPPDAGLDYRNKIMQAGLLWDVLEAAGVPDVTGACLYTAHFLAVVSIRQRYPGHAKQAARLAAASNIGVNRYTVVVDDDIDVTDLDEVLWAMCTRVDPERDIELLRECLSSPLEPIIPPERKSYPVIARVVIDAARPYEWRDRFPEVVASSSELRQQVLARWGDKLKGII